MLTKLEQLDANVRDLEAFPKDKIANQRDRWALRYGLIESIQIVVDIACGVVARRNLGSPATYRECISLLVDSGILEERLGDRLRAMVGMRNLLVHEYLETTDEHLLATLDALDDFRAFARVMTSLEP